MGIKVFGTKEQPLSWSQFKDLMGAARKEVKDARLSTKECHFDWVYRGQRDCEWELVSSLERYYEDEFDQKLTQYNVGKYYRYLLSIIPTLNSLLGSSYSSSKITKLNFTDQHTRLPELELLCHARHLSFPSPLLDWSNSYYVAAYFAFRRANSGKPVSVFAYKQSSRQTWWANEPRIVQLGPLIETHPRHFKQQSIYTYCLAKQDETIVFVPHKNAIPARPRNQSIQQFIIEGKERDSVLEELYLMNINDYTLFGDEESLMRTLAFKAFRSL